MIRTCYSWIHTLILASQYNPPRFVELIMLGMALIMLTISTFIADLPYLVLGLSFVVGASASILVREAIAPTPQSRVTKITALLLLVVSIYGFADLFKLFISFT
ncbi:hypothetical protein Riv7116_5721 [Rivularia sp. PCC 7116]|uniref:hypothetical protein n=1 Tax=Rivularia sp. PCC 7116 TaxID=373994 RepID=UPI00029ECF91|nr:hypothetical protein [Rivularia sp. PCC 7116]AFY58087.1 hypothetical protein Riv7116_5721 [Rivularia sp. PCC 7116]